VLGAFNDIKNGAASAPFLPSDLTGRLNFTSLEVS
jgi:hypothetical protein